MNRATKFFAVWLASTGMAFQVYAATPSDTIVAVGPEAPNVLDIQVPGANVYAGMAQLACYDRLVTWGTKATENGSLSFDSSNIQGELAESWEIVDGGRSIVFNLRKDATFHDGTPVTAEDVRWSFERVVSIGGFPGTQMAAGGYKDPSQFVVVDDHTFKVDFDPPNKLALADVGVPVPVVYNSDLAREHVTEDDPWAIDFLSQNCAGGGAYRVDEFVPNESISFVRFDDWTSGTLPPTKRIVYRKIESDGTRRSLLEKGDVDFSIGLSKKDLSELAQMDNLKVESVAAVNSQIFIDLNTAKPPFDNVLVRRAIAHAIPYDSIIDTAFFGYANALTGHEPGQPYPPHWPALSPYDYDLNKARELLAEAGYPDGFKTTLSYDQGLAGTREPIALLMQESLAKIGIEVEINNIPGANFMGELDTKELPMVIAYFYAWLDYPEYFFFWNFHGGENSVHNASNYQNQALDDIIEAAYVETDREKYDALISDMVGIVMDDMPRVPLTPVYVDVAMQSNIEGYVYWFHTLPDFRTMSKLPN